MTSSEKYSQGRTDSTALFDPTQKVFAIVKELRYNVICSSVDFCLEVFKILDLVRVLHVSLWIPRNRHAKKVTICVTDVLDEIDSIRKSIFALCPAFLPARRVASECKNVLDPGGFCSLELRIDFEESATISINPMEIPPAINACNNAPRAHRQSAP